MLTLIAGSRTWLAFYRNDSKPSGTLSEPRERDSDHDVGIGVIEFFHSRSVQMGSASKRDSGRAPSVPQWPRVLLGTRGRKLAMDRGAEVNRQCPSPLPRGTLGTVCPLSSRLPRRDL